MCPTGTSLRSTNATGTTPELRPTFDVIDADRDGKISGDDLRSFYVSVSGEIKEEETINAMIAVADANKDGYVQYDEFERVLNGKGGQEKEKCYGDGGVMEDVFRSMDQDGDGRLGLDDLRSYLGRAGVTVGEDEIKAMIRLGGGDEREGVSFQGLVGILAVHDLVS